MSFPWETLEPALSYFGIILIILLTVGGNLVVLFAFCNDPHLLTPSNNFLLSMAIADLLVGLICMPFHSYAQIKNFWPFGELFCKIWITIDDVATMASVLSIVAITIERYWSINHSVHYRRYTTKARIRLFSLLIWLIPFVNFAPGIWLLKAHDDPQLLNGTDNLTNKSSFECIGAYHANTLYLIVAQINFCAWPLAIIIVLNGLIVVNLYKRSHRFPAFASFRVPLQKQSYRKNTLREPFRQKLEEEQDQRQQQHLQQQQQINNDVQIETAVDESNCGISNLFDLEVNISKNNGHVDFIPSIIRESDEIAIEDRIIDSHPSPAVPLSSLTELEAKEATHLYKHLKYMILPSPKQIPPMIAAHCSSKSTQTLTSSPSIRQHNKCQSIFSWRKTSVVLVPAESKAKTTAKTIKTNNGEQRTVRRLRRDKRAATSLFILVLVFMIFLLPYVVVVVVGRTFSIELLTNTKGQVYSAAFWLLWLNSTINPILYPFIQPRFREAYRKLFIRLTRRRTRLFSLIVDIQRNK